MGVGRRDKASRIFQSCDSPCPLWSLVFPARSTWIHPHADTWACLHTHSPLVHTHLGSSTFQRPVAASPTQLLSCQTLAFPQAQWSPPGPKQASNAEEPPVTSGGEHRSPGSTCLCEQGQASPLGQLLPVPQQREGSPCQGGPPCQPTSGPGQQ
jgi:hypothetical protein